MSTLRVVKVSRLTGKVLKVLATDLTLDEAAAYLDAYRNAGPPLSWKVGLQVQDKP